MLELFYILYAALSLVYLLVRIWQRRPWWTDLILIVCIPFAGLLIALWASLPPFRSRSDQQLSDKERFAHLVYRGDEGQRIPQQVDVDKEVNLVPLEEALYISDVMTRRRMLLDVLKTEMEAMPGLLEAAISNEDTETSHYAVSAVTELKSKLTLMMQKLAVRYEHSPDDPELLLAYVDILKRSLELGFLDRHMQAQYRLRHAEVLDRLLREGEGNVSHYIDKIQVELLMNRGEQAEYWISQFYEAYPDREEPYLSEMKLRYELNQKDRLLDTLQAFRNAPIRATPETLGVIRFWLQNSE
ncbi:hypothetical protein [Paenibacillus sp. J2TS4]|uniref:hypothetical protein n=1 Tax=Paenibacillus sp. J2TS4 TaxID=2807194 RepID=UPI001B0DF30F|nr:hypothetical protein [Paenibacillus sp. J2TS4]GIP33752.1 hypothetical protein J2TS4_29620 [Paenibacillus sp. J2TS4]